MFSGNDVVSVEEAEIVLLVALDQLGLDGLQHRLADVLEERNEHGLGREGRERDGFK